jgi:hypothetical protein
MSQRILPARYTVPEPETAEQTQAWRELEHIRNAEAAGMHAYADRLRALVARSGQSAPYDCEKL